MSRKKLAAIYLEAARIVFEDKQTFSCLAIDRVVKWDSEIESQKYSMRFSHDEPSGKTFHPCADLWVVSDYIEDPIEIKEWRLTALCFAAAMAGTGDL